MPAEPWHQYGAVATSPELAAHIADRPVSIMVSSSVSPTRAASARWASPPTDSAQASRKQPTPETPCANP